jgi:hypothetical protein
MLEARIAVLEKQIEFLLRLNGLNLSTFRKATEDQLLQVYRDAVQLLGLSDKRIDLEVVERWSEIFQQISEIEIIRLQPIVEHEHPWEPFYLVCVRMMTEVRTHPKLHMSLRTQQLYALLDKGLRNLRSIGAVMIRKFPENVPEKALILLDGDSLEKHLKK